MLVVADVRGRECAQQLGAYTPAVNYITVPWTVV